MRTIIILTLILTETLFVIQINAQHGIAPEWTSDIELPTPPGSNSVRGFLYSNMAVLSDNRRIVFLNKQDGPGSVFFTQSDDGINWSIPQLFEPVNYVIGLNSPKIISDHLDRIHIVWASQMPKALFYSQMDADLNYVLDSVRISDQPDFNKYSDMYISTDLKGRIHLMWNEGKTGVDLPEIQYSQSFDSGVSWSSKQTLSNQDNLPSSFPRGQFNAYSGDTLAIFWRDSVPMPVENWDLQMVVSENGGQTWGNPIVINEHANMQGDPDLVIDPTGRFHLFYHEAPINNPYWGMRIQYGYSDDLGATWQPSEMFNNVISLEQRSYLAEGSRYDIENNVLWTFWKEEDIIGLQGGDMMAAYSLNRGKTWSTPEYVTDQMETSIGFKAVALLPNGGLGINYELPNYPSNGLFRVFYKERSPILVSVREYIEKPKIALFPNPTSSDFELIGLPPKSLIRIANIQGRLMKSIYSAESRIQIELNEVPSGVYFVSVTDESGNWMTTKKIWKM